MNKFNETPERPESNSLAMDVAGGIKRESKAKDLGIICLTIAIVAITVTLSAINYNNDRDWRRLFSSYDFVSQDGEGYNYFNSNIQGDVDNGSAN